MFQFLAVTMIFIAVTLGDTLSERTTKEYPAFLARSGRIINGEEIPITHVPWLVSLKHAFTNETGTYSANMCGGSIISSHWVLTAAHCLFYNNKMENLVNVVTAGAVSHRNSSTHRIAIKIRHSLYEFVNKTNTTVNDIAVLRVVEPFIFDLTRRPVPLYVRAKWTLGKSLAVISGWGSTKTEGNGGWPQNFKAAVVGILTTSQCNGYLSWVYKSTTVPCGQICGYNGGRPPAGAKATCNGDSGGPVTVNGFLVGVISWGSKPCGGQGVPDVYTEAALYRYWISEQTGI